MAPTPDEEWEPWPGPFDDRDLAYQAMDDVREVARRFQAGFQDAVYSAILGITTTEIDRCAGPRALQAWLALAGYREAADEGRTYVTVRLEGSSKVELEIEISEPPNNYKFTFEDGILRDFLCEVSLPYLSSPSR